MKLFRCLYCFLIVFIIAAPSALAYIDPATTSYVIQIIAGVLIAGGATLGIYRHKVKRFFRKHFGGKKDVGASDSKD